MWYELKIESNNRNNSVMAYAGSSDYRAFVSSRVNTKRLPYLVICTHVHFGILIDFMHAITKH